MQREAIVELYFNKTTNWYYTMNSLSSQISVKFGVCSQKIIFPRLNNTCVTCVCELSFFVVDSSEDGQRRVWPSFAILCKGHWSYRFLSCKEAVHLEIQNSIDWPLVIWFNYICCISRGRPNLTNANGIPYFLLIDLIKTCLQQRRCTTDPEWLAFNWPWGNLSLRIWSLCHWYILGFI